MDLDPLCRFDLLNRAIVLVVETLCQHSLSQVGIKEILYPTGLGISKIPSQT
jgi:hypothetical protein